MSSPSSKTRILDSALALIVRRGGADVTMAAIAKAARVSRQAVYLHFADRADLLVALVRHLDEKRGIPEEVRKMEHAATGLDAVRMMVSLQARLNPTLWAPARAVEAVRRRDPAAERSWQDRLQNRLNGCRAIIDRMAQEGTLKPGLNPTLAGDLLWTLTSLRTWEDLVLERGWTAAEYEKRVTEVVFDALTAKKK
jgi:AcrR family transcriptional regulator